MKNNALKLNRRYTISLIIVALSGLFISISAFSQQGVKKSKSPLMGWASWNQFGAKIDETLIKTEVDALVSSGLSKAGYKYFNIDDGFFNGRYADGKLKIDSLKFPSGMKSLVDYIHAKGLKAGFYSEAGVNTCGSQWSNQPGGVNGGMYNHDQQDADLFFKVWGFDFLKVDYCGGLSLKLDEMTRYTAIKNAIDNTGRTDINLNICRWQFPGTWVTSVADSWRMSFDINLFPGSKPRWKSILDIIDLNKYLAPYASAGHYNDMDMLEVGRGLSAEEDRSHFSMWCILSSPLVLGHELTKMTPETKEIITNAEVIAVNQDTSGLQAHLITDNGSVLQVWAKNINGKLSKERAVVLFNRTETPAPISVKWNDLNITGPALVRNLWSHTDLGSFDSVYTETVPAHGVIMLKVVGKKAKIQEVFEAEYAWINNFNLSQNSEVVSGQGRVIYEDKCSGKAKAGWLGKRADNYIEFRDIYANTAGSYNLTITYISPEKQSATMSVNGVESEMSDFESKNGSELSQKSIAIKLNKGYNTIRFSNATDWLPDFDKIHIDLNR
jgi:hypothetical protein